MLWKGRKMKPMLNIYHRLSHISNFHSLQPFQKKNAAEFFVGVSVMSPPPCLSPQATTVPSLRIAAKAEYVLCTWQTSSSWSCRCHKRCVSTWTFRNLCSPQSRILIYPHLSEESWLSKATPSTHQVFYHSPYYACIYIILYIYIYILISI